VLAPISTFSQARDRNSFNPLELQHSLSRSSGEQPGRRYLRRNVEVFPFREQVYNENVSLETWP
jgi:hypothetical protein